MAINVNALVALADKNTNDELAEYGVALPEGIAAALREEMEKENKQAATAAAREIIGLLKASDIMVQKGVENIRLLRAEVTKVKTVLSKIQLAKEYGMETNNWLPLAVAVNYLDGRTISVLENPSLAVIPDNWKSKKAKDQETE